MCTQACRSAPNGQCDGHKTCGHFDKLSDRSDRLLSLSKHRTTKIEADSPKFREKQTILYKLSRARDNLSRYLRKNCLPCAGLIRTAQEETP